MPMSHRVVDGLLVAWKARLVGLGHLEAGPAAAGVAVVAVKLSTGDARASQPGSERIILSQVAAVGPVVGMLVGHEIVMVEKRIAGAKAGGHRDHLGVAGCAHVIHLRGTEFLRADDLDVLGCVPGDLSLAHHADVLGGRTVTRLATDPRFGPGCAISVGRQIVVRGELADVTVETGRVECEHPVGPVERGIGPVREMTDTARRRVVPVFLRHVVSNRHDLEPPPVQRRQEIVRVLAAQNMDDGIRLLSGGTRLAHDPVRRAHLGANAR